MRIVFCLFIAVCFFLSCKKDNNNDMLVECEDTSIKTITLNNCAQKTAANSEPEICFIELTDSRCPANMICVWEGVGIAKFSFKTNSAQHLLTLATKKFPNLPSTDTTVSGYHVQLLDIIPYPGTGNQTPQAVLQITR